MEVCTYVYNPVASEAEASEPFIVNFERDMSEQEERAERVIAHLNTLDETQMVEQTIQFFKWIVLYHTSVCNLTYAERLLAYFHSRGFLTHKKEVNNPQKQRVSRYLVIFTMASGEREHVFSKTYNSIRELKADTGKKPSQIKCHPTKQLFCRSLKNKI
jgi:hypothetical protein